MGYGEVSSYPANSPHGRIPTPNIDKMASEGIRFTNAYAGETVCAPSRCSLMTGKHTGHTWIRGNRPYKGSDFPLRENDTTFAELLKDVGYSTALFGKWGLGNYDSTGAPLKKGFDTYIGILDQNECHNMYPLSYWNNNNSVPLRENRFATRSMCMRKDHPCVWIHDIFVNNTISYIKQHAHDQNPFFAFLSLTDPHAAGWTWILETGAPVPDNGIYGNKKEWPVTERDHAAQIALYEDKDVGNILSLLKQLKIDEETIVFFTSDNGAHAEGFHDPKFFDSTGGLKGFKRSLYEGGIRVPMIVRWPNHIPAGIVSDYSWGFWDFLPTIMELASFDIETPYNSSISSSPSISEYDNNTNNNNNNNKTNSLVQNTYKYKSILNATNKLSLDGISIVPTLFGLTQEKKDYLYWEFCVHNQWGIAVRKNNWKLVRFSPSSLSELYNLQIDPFETNNIASTHQSLVKQLEMIGLKAHEDHPYFPIKNCEYNNIWGYIILTILIISFIISFLYIEEGYVTFTGEENKLHCFISIKRLELFPESWLYKTWLKGDDGNRKQFFTGYPERNLDLIIKYMNGEPINLDLKSKKELEILKSDFEELEITPPTELMYRLNTYPWNDGLDGVYRYCQFFRTAIEHLSSIIEEDHVLIQQQQQEIKELKDSIANNKNSEKENASSIDSFSTKFLEINKTQEELSSSLKSLETLSHDTSDQLKTLADDTKNGFIKGLSYFIRQDSKKYSLLYSNNNNNIQKTIDLPTSYCISNKTNFIDSSILNGNSTYIYTLNSWVGKGNEWNLLFRASEHEYSASEFHQYCDDKGPTMTIIKHIGHDNKINIFGGYTNQSWKSNNDKPMKTDDGAFLYTLNNEHDIPPTLYMVNDKYNAIFCKDTYGPSFIDFLIGDFYNNSLRGLINSKTNCYSFIKTPLNRSLFINTKGPKEDNDFIISEYEVYSLKLNPKLYLPESYIVNKEMCYKISEWFDSKKKWKLLYRCSDENKSVEKWHEKCDEKESLIIIKGRGGDDQTYIFGGYTSVGWGKNHTENNNPLRPGMGYREDPEAFLFSITNPFGYNYVRFTVDADSSSSALISNDPLFPICFCSGFSIYQDEQKKQFTYGRLGSFYQHTMYSNIYINLGNNFFANNNSPNDVNIFNIIDFEIYGNDSS
ncbi:hypothetical protein WA158_005731 [Blastocystis sp. Blastoise]